MLGPMHEIRVTSLILDVKPEAQIIAQFYNYTQCVDVDISANDSLRNRNAKIFINYQ